MRLGGKIFSVYLANHHLQPEMVLDLSRHHSPSNQDRSESVPVIDEIGIGDGDIAAVVEVEGAIGGEVARGIEEVGAVVVGSCGDLDVDSAVAGPTADGADFRTAC